MSIDRALAPTEIREIGEALYGSAWQGAMAKALGVPRQSVSYYLKSGVNGAQAAAILGLVARVVLRERVEAETRRVTTDTRDSGLRALLTRLEAP